MIVNSFPPGMHQDHRRGYLKNRVNENHSFSDGFLSDLSDQERHWIEECAVLAAARRKQQEEEIAAARARTETELQQRKEQAVLSRQRSRQLLKPFGYQSQKEAFADGWQEKKPYHYGGEQLELANKTLVKNPREGKSRSAWEKHGYQVKWGESPYAQKHFYPGKSIWYGLYRHDQVISKKEENKDATTR